MVHITVKLKDGIYVLKKFVNNLKRSIYREGECMYKELNKNESFSNTYATWIIAYCLDTDSFFRNKSETFLLGI